MNRDIIFFSSFHYDSVLSSSALSLAIELSKNNRVFYINQPYTLSDVLCAKFNSIVRNKFICLIFRKYKFKSTKYPNLIEVLLPPFLPTNFINNRYLYKIFSGYNQIILQYELKTLIKTLKIVDYIYINSFSPYYDIYFNKCIHPQITIYQCLDDISQNSYSAKYGMDLEQQIIEKYDITLVSSKELYNMKSKLAKEIYYFPNAANNELFGTALEDLQMPRELSPLYGKKIIGFIGNIEGRIDYPLLLKISQLHSDKFIVLIGPITNDECKTINLENLKNVKLLGAKSSDTLPSYLKFFDCCIIPFKKNKLTKSIYPLKVNEYLSAGKPIVSTNFSEDILNFSDVVEIACTHEDFLNLIDVAINTNNQEKISQRIKKSKENTWKARVDQFWDIINSHKKSLT